MPYQLCPHCGANREGMPDSIPCWRCKRLPHTAVDQEPTIQQPRPTPQPGQPASAGFNYEQFQQVRHYIPLWLWFTGSFGILLFVGIVLGGAVLFITAAESSEPEDDTVAALASPAASPTPTTDSGFSRDNPSFATAATDTAPGFSANNTPMPTNTMRATAPAALPTNTQPALPTSNVPGAAASTNASGANTSDTIGAAGGGNGSNPTSLPAPSQAPSATATVPGSPTPLVCPGTVLPRLSNGDTAEVVIGNTIRVRDTASLGGDVVMNIGTGERVTITGDPICADGYLWWPVTMVNGALGWVAEGSNTQYFLEPR